MNRSIVAAIVAIPLILSACSGESDTEPIDREPADANPAYTSPEDRINPGIARTFSIAQFRLLGENRSGVDGVGRAPATATSRYVSAVTGSDSNDGSDSAPWKSLQHAADNVDPGTTVYVDDSADYAGGLSITQSGEDGNWIVFANKDAGRAPRLIGGLSRDAVIDIDASYIAIVGFEIANHNRPGLNTDEIGIQIEPRNGDISHIYILNNFVHDLGPPGLTDADCYYNGHAIIAQSEGYRIANLIIEANEISDAYVGNSEVLVVNGLVEEFRITSNYIHDVNNIAIDIIGYEKSKDETTSRGIVADNVVLDASNYWPYCTRGNCTYPRGDESSGGIYVDGGADIDIEFNVVGRTDHGIELQSENGQLIRNVHVQRNVVFNSNFKNFTLGDSENSSESDNEFFDSPALASTELEGCK